MGSIRTTMAVMLTGLALMAFMPEASAQASRTVKKKEATSVTKPAPEKSKSVTRTAPASRNVKPQAQKPQTQKPQTQKPDNKPQKPEAKPQKPPQQPSRPAPRPDNDRHDRPGDNMRPGNRPPAPSPQRPPVRPDHYRPGRPSIVPGRPPRPRPRPIIAPVPIFRPPHGVVIAINISPNKLRLKKARLYDDVDYFYEDGLFYAITEYGSYYEIDPPAGALVSRLPSDVRRFEIDDRDYYRYEDTVYRLVVVEGVPYFEVLGQIY
jgi:hypothetical protein